MYSRSLPASVGSSAIDLRSHKDTSSTGPWDGITGAFDHVLKFADISGPAIPNKGLLGRWRNGLHSFFHSSRKALCKSLGQRNDVLGTFA